MNDQNNLTAGLLEDLQVGELIKMRSHALAVLAELELRDSDWLRLLALARAMALMPAFATPAELRTTLEMDDADWIAALERAKATFLFPEPPGVPK